MHKETLKQSLVIFTDGSSLGNPGPGGWGAVLAFPKLNEVVELGGSKSKTTNNEMELEAVVAALSYAVHNGEETHIFTDSQYLINGITKWVHGWAKNGWKTKSGETVKNLFQWKTLYALTQEKRGKIHWHHLPSHTGIAGNERADTIAQTLARGENIELFRGALQEYPYGDILDIDIQETEAKREAKQKKTGKAHAYLSLLDGRVERHDTWAQCEARVKGKNARYRKALSPEHEQEILAEWKKDGSADT